MDENKEKIGYGYDDIHDITQAIGHAKDKYEKLCESNKKCADWHWQLSEWLEELLVLRLQNRRENNIQRVKCKTCGTKLEFRAPFSVPDRVSCHNCQKD